MDIEAIPGLVLFIRAGGLWSNPLIHFTVIKGLAVGLFIRYPLIRCTLLN